jgi:hypothetical protein
VWSDRGGQAYPHAPSQKERLNEPELGLRDPYRGVARDTEYDRLGPEAFFSARGFAPTTTYELVWDERR